MDSLAPWVAKALTLLLAFIAPVQAILIASLSLVLIDAVVGVWASVKERKKITSHKLRRTLVKSIAWMVAILVGHVMETYMIDGVPVVKTVAGLIAITEGKSIFENLYRITGVNFWQMILDKLQGSSIKLPPEEKP